MTYTVWSVIAGETPTATKWNILGVNDDDFDVRLTKLLSDKTLLTASDGAPVTFDLANSKLQIVTIQNNRTLAVSNVEVGVPFGILIKQGTGGGKSVTWWSGIDWPSNTEPPLSTVEAEIDIFVFIPTSLTTFIGLFAGFAIS